MATDRSSLDVPAVIERIKTALGINTDAELANFLNVSYKTVASWKNRNSIPMEIILIVGRAAPQSIDYILFGRVRNVDIGDDILDNSVVYLAGQGTFRIYMEKFAKEKLKTMSRDEIKEEGRSLGVVFGALYLLYVSQKKEMVEKGGFTEAEFDEYILGEEFPTPSLMSRAEELRARLRQKPHACKSDEGRKSDG